MDEKLIRSIGTKKPCREKCTPPGKKPKLNENQQIVLEWVKEQVSIGNDLQYVLWEFTDNVYEEPATYSVSEQTKAWLELKEQATIPSLASLR